MMAELLVVAVVVLVIFTVLFTNFLPTKGEYEKRLEYNDIDTLYGNYYLRILLLRHYSSSSKVTPTLNNGYLTIVSNGICTSNYSYGNITCQKIVNHYKITDVVITNYNPKNYTGPLSEYINYLDIEESNDEYFRITSKTSEGYSSDKFYSKICGKEIVTYGPWKISCGDIETCESAVKKVRTYRSSSKPTNCDENPLCSESSGSYVEITYPCNEECSCSGLSNCTIGTQILYRAKYIYKMEQELEEQNFSIAPCN